MWTRFLVMALAMTPLGATAADNVLNPDSTVRGDYRHPQTWRLAVHEGDFVQGSLSGGSLRLLDGRGDAVRLLVDGEGLSRDFMFVAERDETVLLRPEPANDSDTSEYELHISRLIPRSTPSIAAPEPASPALRELFTQIRDGDNTDRFWAERARLGTPMIEQSDPVGKTALVTFLWRGAERNVKLFGAPSGNHDDLARLPGTDVWYRSYRVPTSTRISYQLAPDVPALPESLPDRRRALLATAQRDPLNPSVFAGQPGDDRWQQKSLLTLPDAPQHPELLPDASVPAGTMQRQVLESALLGNQRAVYLYRPAGWQPNADERGLLVLFDAHAYLRQVPTATLLDNLIAQRRIIPTAALIIANPDAAARARELPPNQDFARFLAQELLPWARTQGISASAANTVIAGSSYGGIASSYAALRYPDRFGNVLSLSGSLWWSPPHAESQWLTRLVRDGDRLPVRFFLRAGLFEPGKASQAGILDTNRHFRDVLKAKGYQVDYGEFAGGHDYAQWGPELSQGLQVLLGMESRREAATGQAASVQSLAR